MAGNALPTYPREYFQIILALNPDGTPLVLECGSFEQATRTRLDFYNFLKWCRRPKNVHATAHLDGRYNQMAVGIKGSAIHFQLRTAERFAPLNEALLKAMEGMDLPELPESITNPARTLPKGEAWPLRPDLSTTSPVPVAPTTPGSRTLLADPHGTQIPQGGFFPMPDWVQEEALKGVALSAMVAAQPREVEIVETQWFPATLRTGTAAPHGPQDKLQWVMNIMIFECRPAELPFPVSKGDTHEVSEVLTGKREAEWGRFFMDIGWDACIGFSKIAAKGVWVFNLNEEGEKRLKSQGITSIVRIQADADLALKNKLRATISELLKGL